MEGLLAPAEAKQHPRALRANPLDACVFGAARVPADREGPIHPRQGLVKVLLQGQDAAHVARQVPHAPMVLTQKRLMLRERLTKRTFGVGKPAERCQRDGEIVGQIRYGQRVGAHHLPAHGNGLSLHGFCRRMLVHVTKQRRIVVHQTDGPGMMARAGILEDSQGLLIQRPRSLPFAASIVVRGQCSETHGQIGMVPWQHPPPNLEGLRKEGPGSVEICTCHERSESKQRPRSLLVLVAVHAAMPVEGLLEKAARS